MTRPLVIGVGQGGVASLADEVRDRLAGMDLIIADARFHTDLPEGPEIWSGPLHFQIFII